MVDVDIKGFFDNVNHGKLLKQMWTLGIRDKKLLSIISAMLKAEVAGIGFPEKGTPQGGIISPLLSNIVLNELDWWIASQWEKFPTHRKYSEIHLGDGNAYDARKYSALRNGSRLKEVTCVRYRMALEQSGVAYDAAYILNRTGEQATECETEELIHTALRRGLTVDGILASSDRSAFGAMTALRSRGLYVPEDVRLVSFDNSPYMATDSVTALDRNPDALAERACDTLLALLAGKETILESIVPVSLVARDSTR